jgi:DNA-binding MarR family transcriptional regulator
VAQGHRSGAAGAGRAADDSVVADWRTVAAAVARVQRRVDAALERAGIPAQWFSVLHQLLQADDHRLAMNQLAREASMTSGGFTKLADRMARDGLIDRRGSADDRRVVHATLTAAGLTMARTASQVYRETLQTNVLDAMTRDALATAADSTRDLATAAEEVPTATFAVDGDPGPVAGLRRRRDDTRD